MTDGGCGGDRAAPRLPIRSPECAAGGSRRWGGEPLSPPKTGAAADVGAPGVAQDPECEPCGEGEGEQKVSHDDVPKVLSMVKREPRGLEGRGRAFGQSSLRWVCVYAARSAGSRCCR